MCGIGGIAYADPRQTSTAGLLEAMAGAMYHRGPDDQGLHREPGCGLSFRRLGIIDLDGGHQPLSNEDDTLWLICNGEIYNYRQLRRGLQARGHIFRSGSDAEVILHLYEERGLDCLGELQGMFALALWDRRQRCLLLARDRLGIKPLYYTMVSGNLAFASEIKPLLTLPGVNAAANLAAIDSYLTLRFVPAPLTFFREIYKLRPGHYLTYHQGRVKDEGYWDLPAPGSFTGTADEAAATLLALLQETVGSHLQSEAPVGLFLSGGLDSSTILALAAREGVGRLQTFSLGFTRANQPHQGFWELAAARGLARYYATDHHEIEVAPGEVPEALARMVWQLEEPLGDPTMIPLYFISREASGRVKVVLSGEGADEIFAGYEVYLEPWQRTLLHRLPLPMKQRLLASLAACWPAGWPGKNFLRRAALPVEAWYRGVGFTFSEEEKAGLYGPALGREVQGSFFENQLANYFQGQGETETLAKMLYFDIKYWLADDTLIKSDKLTMARSLELRVPFLDHRVVEFAAALPAYFKVRGNSLKYILRKATAALLPAAILQRQKLGFTAPITVWVNGELHSFAVNLLTSPQFRERHYFRQEDIDRLLQDTRPHPARGRQIFALMVLELWHRLFIDGEKELALPQETLSFNQGFKAVKKRVATARS
ncbi:asparagine synthase (glutamine-hydrolyzing) [Moorella naiadis]|uniref:asparagine synthase (glutamine-hydrolyzing) n=1 Tax=Moorella naiadis (nom. illeg.) TaxID=3093670 RepID=UPI003D9CB9EB